jgi:ATP/maltotriose-dependent transcriptional regulator MalT
VLGEVGERYVRSTIAGMLGEVLCDLGRFDEAEEVSRTAEELASEDDVESQALWRSVRARVLAQRGDLAEAESLARAAVELAAATDGVIMRLAVLFDLAEVLLYAGLTDEAAVSLAEAAKLAESKGNLVVAGRAAAQLEELRGQPFATQA